MFVPKAAVNENHCLILWKYDVRAAGERLDVFSISESLSKKILANQLFWLRVLTSNMGHIHAADFFAVIVSHRPHLLRGFWSACWPAFSQLISPL